MNMVVLDQGPSGILADPAIIPQFNSFTGSVTYRVSPDDIVIPGAGNIGQAFGLPVEHVAPAQQLFAPGRRGPGGELCGDRGELFGVLLALARKGGSLRGVAPAGGVVGGDQVEQHPRAGLLGLGPVPLTTQESLAEGRVSLGKRVVELVLLAPVIVPAIAVSMGIQVMFIRYGLADTIPGVVLVHLIPTIPYVVLVMGAVFANYDTSYEEQARVLGANPLRVFMHVTFPAVLPGLVVAAFFAFLISWSEYLMTLIIGGGIVITLPILLFQFVGSDPSIAAALSLFFIAPAIVLMILTSRYLSGDQSAVGGIGRA